MAKIIKAGNSIAVTIPAKFARKIGVKAGDEVRISTSQLKSSMTVTFKSARQLPLIA